MLKTMRSHLISRILAQVRKLWYENFVLIVEVVVETFLHLNFTVTFASLAESISLTCKMQWTSE